MWGLVFQNIDPYVYSGGQKPETTSKDASILHFDLI